MFSRFAYDLTAHMKPGRNELSVYVSMEKLTGTTHPMSEAVTVNLTAAKVMTLSKGMFGPLSPNRPDRDYDLHGHLATRAACGGVANGKIDDSMVHPFPERRGNSGGKHSGSTKATNGVLRATWTDVKTRAALCHGRPCTYPIRDAIRHGVAFAPRCTPKNCGLPRKRISTGSRCVWNPSVASCWTAGKETSASARLRFAEISSI